MLNNTREHGNKNTLLTISLCRSVPDVWQPKLDHYLGSELSPEDMRGVDTHLRDCP